MASLRDVVSQYKEELRDGIAWVAFWKEGRSWKAEYFYLESSDDTLSLEDKARLEEICSMDPGAVVLNGYYCGYLAEDMSIREMVFGVRCHYENGYNKVDDFIQSHEPGRFKERLEEAKKDAHSVGMPFAGAYDPDEDIDPYVYNGKMSVEDVERMHQLMQENEKPVTQDTRKENKPMLSVIIPKDKKRLEQSIAVLEWQLEHENSETDRVIHMQVLEAYRRALNHYPVKEEVQPLSAIS